MIDQDNFGGSVIFMSSAWISEYAVLADGLDRFLLAVDVVPAGLLKVPAVVCHKLHLHAVLKRKGQLCESRSFIGLLVCRFCGLA